MRVAVALALSRTTYRSASGWSWRSVLDVLGVKQPSKDLEATRTPSDVTIPSDPQSREELLRGIACAHLREIDDSSWKRASLGDTHLKGKTFVDGMSMNNALQTALQQLNPLLFLPASRILCDYESTFSQSISNQDLGAINTFEDLLEILKNYTPPLDSPNVYPLFRDDVTLPPNLCIQFINTAPTVKPDRHAFQNYDARHPEHAKFLTNMEKVKKRKTRRHLTVWKHL